MKAEADSLKHCADETNKTGRRQEAFGLYIKAGLRYLQCGHERETTNMAFSMYQSTIRFFEDVAGLIFRAYHKELVLP